MSRTLHLVTPPMKGPDVKELKKDMKAKGLFDGPMTNEYGPHIALDVKAAKKKFGYPRSKQLPVAGDTFRKKLKAYKPPKPKPKVSAADKKRAKIVEYCEWGVQHNGSISYAQERRMDRMNDLKHLPERMDCSEFATKACKYAGAPDPNGFGYNGDGYTGSMLQHCRHITQAMAKKGDLVVFGGYPGHHVVVLVEDGNVKNPMTVSQGSNRDPRHIRVWDEAKYQPPGVTFLQTVKG